MTDFAELTLRAPDSTAIATVAPARGGLVTGFELDGRRLLFMDESTLHDPTKSVRGGIPVLFPAPGKLEANAWTYAKRRGTLKQHGFARDLPWHVAHVSPDAAELRLLSNEETRAQFPWDFVVTLRILVAGRSLRLEQTVTNRSESPMPFGFGFHPYFHVPQAAKRETTIETRATRAFDNVAKRSIALSGIDLTGQEVDLHLLDHGSSQSELRSPLGRVQLRGSPEYSHWVVWTLAGRDFVCLEPWTCPGNALNTGERLLVLAPGTSRMLELEISG
jgi:galactose mutarotase-like enzyme